ncbi:putative ORF3 [Torque teno didelphis albiventris virus]|uniref:Putative ORF3 n=1 Tax=Torque teno didelphis albiventris virus TaxID=2054619 RepID=A0A2H4QBT6_9VIRU|nr:putative ORF3 [Torque teno didelphis albiventris virus]ATX61860.1 putative ORF3 [Torque teno didelphis albiventris virus]
MSQTLSLIPYQTNQQEPSSHLLPEPVGDYNKYRYKTRQRWAKIFSTRGTSDEESLQKEPLKELQQILNKFLSQRSGHRLEKKKSSRTQKTKRPQKKQRAHGKKTRVSAPPPTPESSTDWSSTSGSSSETD